MANLKECPKCQEKRGILYLYDEPTRISWCACSKCGFKGPREESPSKAVNEWNGLHRRPEAQIARPAETPGS